MIQSLRDKGGKEWYGFLKDERMPDCEHVESLKVNGAVVTGKEEMRRVIKEFWEEIEGIREKNV
ncbi:hypothetical protein E2C01_018472 [Portunus trituberculatus]|uniref:Uncharacterized protein n=1 Tax=Portunus trituberculatus TaxID=210409 RepID=A0A5B7DWH7_PORTR|nr:hypothetical protein [Portunus trituberculatus]